MSEKESEEVLHNFTNLLMSGDIEEALSVCTEDVVFRWMSTTFKGKEEIRHWSSELRRIFKLISLEEIKFVIKGDKMTHEFMMYVTVPDGRRGATRGIGTYDMENGKINLASIAISTGFLIFSREEIERFGLLRR
ncbi:MAG: Nuclear transport factor 2 family protein [Thermoproteota archaeon]|nr:Nuclear transport factor 2 family protein [Thermoproteota archaeon]